MNIEAICIGNASYDMFFFMDGFPLENKKYVVNSLLESGGGPAANEAYLLAKWGIRSAFSGLIGDDIYGKQIIEDFKQIGVNTDFIDVRAGYPTPFSNIIINKQNGNRTVINRRSLEDRIIIAENRFRKLNPNLLLFDGNDLELSLKAMEYFPDAVTMLDAGSYRKQTFELAKKVDFVIASEDFALELCGLDRIKTMADQITCLEHLFKINKNNVIITLGENGLIYFDENGIVKLLPAYQVIARDTTGAGDIFHGAFAYCYLRNMSLLDSLEFSSIAAAISVTKEGSRKSIPDLNEVTLAYQQVKK